MELLFNHAKEAKAISVQDHDNIQLVIDTSNKVYLVADDTIRVISLRKIILGSSLVQAIIKIPQM